ncbi:hypothetical protein EBZ35_01515 [bacterium]|nr:hypothetical protein [bacterium]
MLWAEIGSYLSPIAFVSWATTLIKRTGSWGSIRMMVSVKKPGPKPEKSPVVDRMSRFKMLPFLFGSIGRSHR